MRYDRPSTATLFAAPDPGRSSRVVAVHAPHADKVGRHELAPVAGGLLAPIERVCPGTGRSGADRGAGPARPGPRPGARPRALCRGSGIVTAAAAAPARDRPPPLPC